MSGTRQATVEDCDSDSNDIHPHPHDETRPTSRPHTEVEGGGPSSDSGYSSHPAGTVASGEYAGSKPSSWSPSVTRRAAEFSSRRHSTMSSSRNADPRAVPVADPRGRALGRSSAEAICECKTCLTRARGIAVGALETPWDLELPALDPRGHYADVALPLSSVPRRYAQGVPMTQMPRQRQPIYRSARPTSFHDGAVYAEEGYFADPYTSAPVDMSYAYPAVPAYPSRPSYASRMSAARVEPAHTYAYEEARPAPMPRRATERFTTRPTSTYGVPVIDYAHPPPAPASPSRASPSRSRPTSSRDRPEIRRYASREEEDSFRMPPPPPPLSRPTRRTSVRQPSDASSGARETPRSAPTSPPHETTYVIPDRTGRTGRTSTSSGAERRRAHSTRPSMSSGRGDGDGEGARRTYLDGPRQVEIERKRDRRASYYGGERAEKPERPEIKSERRATYYGPEKVEQQKEKRSSHYGPDKIKELERSAEAYQEATRAAPVNTMSLDAPPRRRRSRRATSSSGSHSRTSSSRDHEGSTRSGSGMALNLPDSDEGFTLRFSNSAGLKLDLGGVDGRTISLKPGQSGHELSIGSRKGYIDRATGAHVEYARSGGGSVRDPDEGRRSRDTRSSTYSRRSSRVPTDRQPFF